jgi:ornithine decarboxylase
MTETGIDTQEVKLSENRANLNDTKYTEMKTLDNCFLQKYDVKLYGSDKDNYDIINDFLQENQSEEAFYIIDLGEIVKSYNNWIRLLPDVKPFYAVKCNSNPVILEALADLGVNFDCASEKEIRSIIDITKDPSRIVFANPIKMSSKIRFARSNDVDILVFDSEYELFKIKLFHPNAKLILRLAVDDSYSLCRFNCKFGSKLSEVEELLTIAKTLKLNIIGFSFHVGSSCLSVEPFYNAISDCRKATDIAIKLGFDISIIDIGGGFPGVDKNIRFEDIANRINDGIQDFFNEETSSKKIQFISEPGRYFAQKTHTLVVNVIGKKIVYDSETSEKINVYYLNEGTYGSFNCIQNDHYQPVLLPFNEQKEKYFKSKIFGQSCDSIDVITNDVLLPELSIGDSLYVENFGSYTLSASSANFNGFAPTNKFKYIFKDHVQN